MIETRCGALFGAELHDADVLAVRLGRVHRLRHVDDPAGADLHFHLLVAERRIARLAVIDEQCGVLVGSQEVIQQPGMEENVTIQDHEAFI